MHMYPNDSIRKQAKYSIEKQLKNFNENLWVPSPEEIAKAKEEQAAKEAKENGETLDNDKQKKEYCRTVRSSLENKQK